MTIYNCDPFGKCFELEKPTSGEEERDFLVEMLFSTSLIAVVEKTLGYNRGKKLKIVNTKRKATICELTFPHEIVDVVMNRKILCVVLDSDQIFVYDISCMKLLKTINVLEEKLKVMGTRALKQRASSSGIKVALSADDKSLLCYTSYSKSTDEALILTDVVIYDAINCKRMNVLSDLHQTDIVCLSCSCDGRLIATASKKGTIIRVFETQLDPVSGRRPLLSEYRRGTRPSRISEIKFNSEGSLLASVGESDTIHIFAVPNINTQEDVPAVSSVESVSSGTGLQQRSKDFATTFGKIVISKISIQKEQRNFAFIKVRENVQYRIGFPKENRKIIHVCGNDGNFLVYLISADEGGTCTLIKSNTFD